MTRPPTHTCAYCSTPLREGKGFIAVRDPGGVSGVFCGELCFDAAKLRAVLIEADLARADYARATAMRGGVWP